MKITLAVITILLLTGVGFFVWQNQSPSVSQEASTPINNVNQSPQPLAADSTDNTNFTDPKKSAHYETNTPEHGSILAAVPVNVVIDFNFDLAKPSEIAILQNDKEFGTGETLIDTNKLSMRKAMPPDVPDGAYTVKYNACWPHCSAHAGTMVGANVVL